MKKFASNLALFVLPILLVCVGLLFAPYDKKFAYNYLQGDYTEAHYIYNRIFENPARIDFAFIGTSHTHNGINDSLIENNLSLRLNQPVKVANLGLSKKGENIRYAIGKDLLKKKKPRVVVLEVLGRPERYSHFAFPILGDAGDVAAPVLFFNRYILRDYSYALQSRYEFAKARLTGGLPAYRPITNNFGFEPNTFQLHPDTAANKVDGPIHYYLGENLKEVEFRYAKAYIRKLYELTKANGSEIVFLYIPSFSPSLDKPLDYEFFQQMGRVWIPPKELFENHALWADLHHFNPRGATLLSEWVADKISREFTSDGQTAAVK